MHSRARDLVQLAEDLLGRAAAGPLPDQRRVISNLRYIREQLEHVLRRHTTPKPDRDDEAVRMRMASALGTLYAGLEQLEGGLLQTGTDLGERALVRLREALAQLESLEQQIEDQREMDMGTL